MGMKTLCAPVLVALAGALAISAAPLAAAAPASDHSVQQSSTSTASDPVSSQSCLSLGSTQSQCQSLGNTQINDSPPQVDYFPYAGGAT
jgi:hypothetical protein